MDTIACVAVNDAFVLDAWGKSVGADGKVLLLADGSALFTKVSACFTQRRPTCPGLSSSCIPSMHGHKLRGKQWSNVAVSVQAIGVDLDLVEKGLGIRSRRYAMLVDNGVVTDLNLEEGGASSFAFLTHLGAPLEHVCTHVGLSLELPTYRILLFLVYCRRLHGVFSRGDSERPVDQQPGRRRPALGVPVLETFHHL